MKLLIVDDAAFMRMMIKNMIVDMGFDEVLEAENGKDAIRKYKTTKPDIVTMDLTMPEMGGIEAIKEIRSVDSSAIVIACSAMGQETMVIEAIKAGAKGFVVKPFEKNVLQDELKKYM